MPPRKPLTAASPLLAPDTVADHRARLVALRDRLTAELDDAPVAYVAAIARQLQSALNELATLPDLVNAPPSKVEEIAARRRARQAAGEITAPDRRRKNMGVK